MPTKIGDASSSRGLVPQTQYTHADKTQHDTRAEESTVQWSIKVSGGVTYLIKFSANFFKKHLYTSSKKLSNVQAEYDKLGSITDEDARWAAAQDAADEAKFQRQLKHRSGDEQKCTVCGHPVNDHPNSGACTKVTQSIGLTGGTKNGKPERGPIHTPCTCTGYSPAYSEKRGLQGKPVLNPLLGATAQTNDAIWMDKIPRAVFEKVLHDALQARYAAVVPTPGWKADGEHIEWDFGAAQRGCILKLAKGTKIADAKAMGYSSVEVTITLDNTDPNNPIFTVGHLDGKKTH
ncbi:MAG: hypothetical protein C0505_14990 [Leptothrix sp. (in: Bacteria)]|nr:hypothetical protein [Leptothrix sp. (in: b-proteobacteria)]